MSRQPDLTELRHGYVVSDIYQMTAAAIRFDRSGAMAYGDRWNVAWSAITEALYAADKRPDRRWLVECGWRAIYDEVRDGRRHNGYRDRQFDAGHASAPKFVKFWYNPHASSPEDSVTEKVAIWQVLAGLSTAVGQIYRDAIVALAIHGDHKIAAESLGISDKAMTARLVTARRYISRLWHEGETPVRHRDLTATCKRGHRWDEHGRTNNQGKRHCMACARIRNASARRKAA